MSRSPLRQETTSPQHTARRSLRGKSTAGGVVVVILLGIYALVAPQLNARFGWSLPDVQSGPDGSVVLPDSGLDQPTRRKTTVPQESNQERDRSDDTASSLGNLSANDASTDNTSPKSSDDATSRANGTPETRAGPLAQRDEASRGEPLRFGLLREVSKDRFLSPAGLLYAPGSAEGHRLEHLRRHTKDDPGRPGKHGVFDGGMDGALETIDQAYERAKKGQRTSKEVDRERTIYRVDMGRRVGYVGGREGGRLRKPMARRVQIVLEGNRVITAFPL